MPAVCSGCCRCMRPGPATRAGRPAAATRSTSWRSATRRTPVRCRSPGTAAAARRRPRCWPWPSRGRYRPATCPARRTKGRGAVAASAPASIVLRGGAATRRAFGREAAGHRPAPGLPRLRGSGRPAGQRTAAGRRAVTLRELLNDYRLQVRLAVLSACETALPGTELPDEVVALPTGLLQAGVAGVVASQWSVPDRATAMLMAEFYRRWSLGEVPVAARCAKPAVAARHSEPAEAETGGGHSGGSAMAADRGGADYFDTAMLGREPDARAHERHPYVGGLRPRRRLREAGWRRPNCDARASDCARRCPADRR